MIRRIISALLLAATATLCVAQGKPAEPADKPIELAKAAPRRYVVVKGDTLWDISAKFLKHPWRWPEIWRMNRKQIRNPHRIYPGDVIILSRDASGRPYLRRETVKLRPKIYETPNDSGAIPPIPAHVIEPFLAAPLVVEADEIDKLTNAPRIVATQNERVNVGNGDLVYANNIDPDTAMWNVYRKGRPLFDPEDGKTVLGYEAFHLGTAKQVRPGEPATLEIQTIKQEIGVSDRLSPATRPPFIDYVPHRPDVQIEGRIISVYGGVGTGGQGSIIAINRGARDGLEIGHVLALERNLTFTERDENDNKVSVQIPATRTGLIFIFRTFAHISYALVMQSDGIIEQNDFVRTP